jgi:ABC-2 type transport system permease protein
MRSIRMVASGGGTPLFLGILFIALYFAYEQFLIWLPPDFSIELLLTLPYALLLTSSRIRTWIQPADSVFLLPLETRMKPYFRASLIYSTAIHLIHLAIFTLLLYPVFLAVWKSHGFFFVSYVFFAVIQVVNIFAEWWQMRLTILLPVQQVRLVTGIRFLFNGGAAYAFLHQQGIWASVLLIGLLLSAIAVYRKAPACPYPWRLMQKSEANTLARYHSLAGLFVDMPRLKTPVKKRAWLIRFLPRWSRQQASSYLYWRTFIRKSELFSIQIRLLIWAMILIGIFPNRWVSAGVCVACAWMFIKQLPQLADPKQYPGIRRLYPLSAAQWAKGLTFIGWINLGIQTVWIALFARIVDALSTLECLWLVITGALISTALSLLYLPRRGEHLINSR